MKSGELTLLTCCQPNHNWTNHMKFVWQSHIVRQCFLSWTLRVVSSSTWCGNIVTALPALCYSTSNAAMPLCRNATVMMCGRQLFIYRQAYSSTSAYSPGCCNSWKGLRACTVTPAVYLLSNGLLETVVRVLQPSLCCTVILNEQQVSF